MKKLILFSTLCLAAACSQTSVNYVARVKPLRLYDTEIYKADKVEDVLFDSEEQNIDSLRNLSRQLFLKGVDAFRNKKEPGTAITLFKRSILALPDAKTYYELGNALLESGMFKEEFEEAEQAFEIAERLNFQPLYLVHYKNACAINHKGENYTVSVGYKLRDAFRAGFSDTSLLKKDKHLESFVKSHEYKNLELAQLLDKMKDRHESLFSIYTKAFALLPADFEIKPEMADMKDYKQSISYDFVTFIPEMQNSNFGRDVSHDFIYVGRLAQTPAYTAVLYASMSYYGEYMQPVHTKLVTYDNEGNIISGIILAGQLSAEKVKSGRIDHDKIYITDYKRIWLQPIDKVAFEENTVLKYEPIAKAVYRLDESGKILEESVPENFNDSVPLAKK